SCQAEYAVEWPQRQSPSLFAGRPIRDQAKVHEECVYVLAVRYGTGRSRIIRLHQMVVAISRHLIPPEELASPLVYGNSEEFVAFKPCHVNILAAQYRGGMSLRGRDFPDDVLVRTELGWKVRRARDARPVGSPELRPLVAGPFRRANKGQCDE